MEEAEEQTLEVEEDTSNGGRLWVVIPEWASQVEGKKRAVNKDEDHVSFLNRPRSG